MSVRLPNGAIISMASTYVNGVAAMTAITNANPGVASIAAHGYTDGAILEISSGWALLDQRIVRVNAPAAGTFELEGIDTLNTSKYPAGAGAGTVRSITAWTQITQILETQSQGGEQQYYSYGFLEESKERQIPTVKSAESLNLTIGDDPTLPWYAAMVAADDDRVARAIRMQLPNGSVIYFNAYVSLNKTPTMTRNEIMRVSASLSFVSESTRYATGPA